MMRRIGGMLVLVGLVGASPAAAQRAVVAPRASLLFASAPSVVEADTSGIRPTYWKEGAILTGVPVGSQADRILVVTVGAEENDGDCDLALGSASATYGGIVMSKAVTRVSNTSSWRACNAIFYLLNPPTGTANVVVNFPTTTASATGRSG